VTDDVDRSRSARSKDRSRPGSRAPRRAIRALIVAALALVSEAAPAAPGGRVHAGAAADRAARPAPADHRRVVGILDVRVEGVADEVKEAFQRGLEQQLDTRRYWLASRARLRQRMLQSTRWTEGCFVGACLTELRAQTSAELVLLAALTGAGTSFGYVVTLVRTDTGQVLQQISDRCDVCTLTEAMSGATQAAVQLVAAAPDELPDAAGAQAAAIDQVRRAADGRGRHTRRVGIALTAIGLAAALGGIALYVAHDHPSYAALTAVGGGGLAAGGLIVLTF
jgi:hypothetical protein